MLAWENNLLHDLSHPVIQANLDSQYIVNHISRAKTLTELCQNLDLDKLKHVQESHPKKKIQGYAGITT